MLNMLWILLGSRNEYDTIAHAEMFWGSTWFFVSMRNDDLLERLRIWKVLGKNKRGHSAKWTNKWRNTTFYYTRANWCECIWIYFVEWKFIETVMKFLNESSKTFDGFEWCIGWRSLLFFHLPMLTLTIRHNAWFNAKRWITTTIVHW